MRSYLPRALLLLAVVVVLPARLRAQHPTHPAGYSSEKAYEVGLVDNVDLFSGTLGLSLPIGPLTLTYSSSGLWTYEIVNLVDISADAHKKSNAGFGWRLGFGDVYQKNHWYNNAGRWQYIDENGGSHIFNSDLHKGEDDGDGSIFYSRDGTYMRFKEISNWVVEIEYADGRTRRFEQVAGGESKRLRFVKEWSRFGSIDDPDLEISYSFDPEVWTITDRYDRTHTVTFGYEAPNLDDAVTEIDLESYQGQRKVYTFTYEDEAIHRSCKDTDSSTPINIDVSFLTQIDLPDGTSYKMKDGSTLLYDEQCHGDLKESPGTLLGIILPTGGKFAWTYDLYTYPDPDDLWTDNTGVKTKAMKDRNDTVLGVWTYTNDSDPPQGNQPEAWTQVVHPTGDCTKHHFNARYWLSKNPYEGWEYGLPFAYSEEDNGFYLSEEVWDSSSGDNCAGTKLRSTYVKYDHDALPNGTNQPEWWANSNKRLVGTRTVFHDDGDRWIQTDYSEFDGLGQFREVSTTGSLWGGSSNNEERVVFTNYNRVTGVYPNASYVPPPVTDPWVLEIYDYVETTESDAVGESVARVEYGFDSDTGALECRRTLTWGSSRSASDVLVAYDLDLSGRITDEKTYGGDLQVLATSGDGCGDLPSEPEYWVTHTYDSASGARRTTQPREPDGTNGPILTYDVDLDASTSLVTISRDPAGLATVYGYDSLGRVTSMAPPERAPQATTYVGATPTTHAQIVQQTISGATTLTDHETYFDDFGRAWKQRVKMPDGSWSEREVLYNARGWVVSASELGDLSEKTEFLNHDAFGRPLIVRPPNGSAHDALFTFQGIRSTKLEEKVALPGGESYVAREREFDVYGRLRKVVENSDAGTPLTSTYSYDVGDRLTQIASGPSSSSVTQERLFSYDNRAFLLSETHPEKGVSGNGTVTYSDYDSSGNRGRSVDGSNDLGYTYDLLGRVLEVRDKGNGNRLLLSNLYDWATGNAMGKLRRSRYYNWVDLPWNAGGEESVEVRRFYTYDVASGDLKTQHLDVLFDGETMKRFIHRYEYDDLGSVSQIEYPFCDQTACAATVGAGPDVDFNYSQGRLTEVVGWTNTLTYHPNGSLHTVPHSNGVTDYQLLDPSYGARPLQLYTTGASVNWDSGAMSYDGTGNITGVGANAFAYDEVSRILSGSVAGWQQDYTYDAFGNLDQRITTDPGQQQTVVTFAVDEATNRLSAGSYDAAGNMTSWGLTSFGYDAMNRMSILDDRWLYVYDADGERVATIDWAGAVSTRRISYAVRDARGQLLSEFEQVGTDTAGNWSRGRDRVRAGSRLLGYEEGSEMYHYHLDHLGSPRLITDEAATRVSSHNYLPYGEEVHGIGSQGDDAMRFTGHERDETGLDNMHARYYNSGVCRMLAVDQGPLELNTPQSFNRYAYVHGRPTHYVDPTGRAASAPLLDPEPEGEVPGGIAGTFHEYLRVLSSAAGVAITLQRFYALVTERLFNSRESLDTFNRIRETQATKAANCALHHALQAANASKEVAVGWGKKVTDIVVDGVAGTATGDQYQRFTSGLFQEIDIPSRPFQDRSWWDVMFHTHPDGSRTFSDRIDPQTGLPTGDIPWNRSASSFHPDGRTVSVILFPWDPANLSGAWGARVWYPGALPGGVLLTPDALNSLGWQADQNACQGVLVR